MKELLSSKGWLPVELGRVGTHRGAPLFFVGGRLEEPLLMPSWLRILVGWEVDPRYAQYITKFSSILTLGSSSAIPTLRGGEIHFGGGARLIELGLHC